MGIQVDPAFNENRRIYTCQGHESGRRPRRPGGPLGPQHRRPPAHPAAGHRHGHPGDERAPRRVPPALRAGPHALDRHRRRGHRHQPPGPHQPGRQDPPGRPVHRRGVDANPYSWSANANKRRILSYGHRNVQGIARRPADGKMWTVEHGTGRDDEINRGVRGNFGWDPVPGYDESTPMTDTDEVPERGPGGLVLGQPHHRHVRRGVAQRLAVGCLGRPPRSRRPEGRVAAHLRPVVRRHAAHGGGDAARRPVRPAAHRAAGPRRCALPHDLERRRPGPHPEGHAGVATPAAVDAGPAG